MHTRLWCFQFGVKSYVTFPHYHMTNVSTSINTHALYMLRPFVQYSQLLAALIHCVYGTLRAAALVVTFGLVN